MTKSFTAHFIGNNAKYVDTAPERSMKEILNGMAGMPGSFLSDQHTNFRAPNRKGILQDFRLQLDFVLPLWESPMSVWVLEVKGEGHKSKNDKWEADHMLGLYVEGTSYIIDKVIYFDGEYLKLKKNRPLAIKALSKALQSADRIVWVDA